MEALVTPNGPSRPNRWRLDFGRPDGSWAPPSSGSSVVEAATAWVCHQLATLRDRRMRAKDLARILGGSETHWRNKLNGGRAFTLSDLLGLAIAIDPELCRSLPDPSEGVGAFVPPSYRDRLSHTASGRGLPEFTMQPSPWREVAHGVQQWWETEVRTGRKWTLSADVVVQKIVSLADAVGVSSQTSTQGLRTEQVREIRWIGKATTAARIVWIDPFERPKINPNEDALRVIGDAIWEAVDQGTDATVVVLVAAEPALHAFRDILSLQAPGKPVTASLREADRLGLRNTDLVLCDVEVELLAEFAAEAPVLVRIRKR